MAYEIEVKHIQEVPVVYGTGTTTQAQMPVMLGELLQGAMAHLGSQGGKPAGPPFTRYLDSRDGSLTIQVGVPYSGEVGSSGDFETGVLPGGEVAVVVHQGPFDQLPKAYQAVAAWLEERGRSAEGSPWEFYWTDPEAESDPSKWKTEIFFPLG